MTPAEMSRQILDAEISTPPTRVPHSVFTQM
jgi:hypothetical protein